MAIVSERYRNRTSKRRGVRAPLILESLEQRDVPADLLGSSLSVLPSSVQPGATIGVTWSVSNTDFDMIFNNFNVGFYLSTDAFISTSDHYLGQFELPAGFPGFYTITPITSQFALPSSGFGPWQGDGTYYIGMVSDVFGQVFESNEWNNANTGWWVDLAPISVIGTQPALPDLSLSSATATPTNAAPGATINVSASLWNNGTVSAGMSRFDTFLSRDAFLDGADRLLGSATIAAIAPFGSTSTQLSVALPPAADPFWNGATSAYLLFKADSDNWVIESNEANNASQGLSSDSVLLTVQSRITLSALPATPLAPGAIQSYVFKTQQTAYSSLIKRLNQLEPKTKRIVSLKPLIAAATAVQKDLQEIARMMEPVRTGKVSRISLGPNASFDRTSLQLLDRLYVATAKGNTSVLSVRALGGVHVRADDDLLKQVQASVRKDILEGAGVGAFEKTAEIFARGGRIAGELGSAAGASVFAKGSGIATALQRMVQFGLANVADLDKTDTERTRNQARDSLVQAYLDEARKLADESIGEASPLAAKLKKLLADLRTLLERGGSTLDKILAGWDLLKEVPPGRDNPSAGPFSGKWKGLLSYPQQLSNGQSLDIGGPMSIQFKSTVRGVYRGAVQMTFTVYDEYFRPVSKSISKGTFIAELDQNLNALFGTLTVKNPNGQVTKTNFNMHETTDGNLVGTLPVNVNSTFMMKRPRR